jgi:pyruvate/2-oxoacid:ferredoxin oxidoreductase beta subunit
MPEATAAAAPKKFALQQYKTEVHVDWCPGCGDFGILSSIQQALFQLQIPPYRVAMISGIGCSGKTPHYIDGRSRSPPAPSWPTTSWPWSR